MSCTFFHGRLPVVISTYKAARHSPKLPYPATAAPKATVTSDSCCPKLPYLHVEPRLDVVLATQLTLLMARDGRVANRATEAGGRARLANHTLRECDHIPYPKGSVGEWG